MELDSPETCASRLDQQLKTNEAVQRVFYWSHQIRCVSLCIACIGVFLYLRFKCKKYQTFNVVICFLLLFWNMIETIDSYLDNTG